MVTAPEVPAVIDDLRSRVPTQGRFGRVLSLARAIAFQARTADLTLLAAAVAFYAFVSMIPLALLAVAVGSTVAGETVTQYVSRAAADLLSPSGHEVLRTALEADAGRGGATLAGVVVLIWGALRLFRGIDRAFSEVYGSTPGTLLKQLLESVLVVGAISVGILAMVVVGTALTRLPVPLVGLGGAAALWLALFVALLPVYYTYPDVGVTLREVVPGAAFAATAFTLLGTVFGFYTTVAGNYAIYGVLGVVLLFVTWLYFASLAVLLGAVLNAVLAGYVGSWGAGE